MAKGFKSRGGGLPMNFRVTGGAVQPETASENTIWISTDQKITSWIFASAAPAEPEEGMVWILTGSSSAVEFNALKNNSLQIYPVSAKQYISGEWADKTAKIYQRGNWVDWIVYLYNCGDSFDPVTGGYKKVSYSSGSEYANLDASLDDGCIYVSASTNQSNGSARCGMSTENAIDLTGVSLIQAKGNCSEARNTAAGVSGVGIRVQETQSVDKGFGSAAAYQYITEVGDFEISIDVSELTGEYYIICFAQQYTEVGYSGSSAGTGTFHTMWTK